MSPTTVNFTHRVCLSFLAVWVGFAWDCRADSQVVAWGDNYYGQTNVPPDLTNVVAVAGGYGFSLALQGDGKVIGWGRNDHSQTAIPVGLSNVISIAAGDFHSVALRSDGTVAAWGRSDGRQTDVPPGLSNVVAIAAGGLHNLAIVDLSPRLLTSGTPRTDNAAFRQTGLLWQTVRVLNPNGRAFPAIRVVVQGLPANAVVFNASGTNALGQPFVQSDQPLPPGASIDLTIEYHAPNGAVPSVTLVGEVVEPATPIEPTGVVQDIARSFRLDDEGSYLIDFRTLANRTYYVQYSSDLTAWKTAFPPVTGSGSTMQWADNGPPKTDSHPRTETNRFYRVLLVP